MRETGTIVIIRWQRTAARRRAAMRPGSAYLRVGASAIVSLLTVVSIFATLPALASGAPSPAPVAQSSAAGAMPSAASSAVTPAQPASSLVADATGWLMRLAPLRKRTQLTERAPPSRKPPPRKSTAARSFRISARLSVGIAIARSRRPSPASLRRRSFLPTIGRWPAIS